MAKLVGMLYIYIEKMLNGTYLIEDANKGLYWYLSQSIFLKEVTKIFNYYLNSYSYNQLVINHIAQKRYVELKTRGPRQIPRRKKIDWGFLNKIFAQL